MRRNLWRQGMLCLLATIMPLTLVLGVAQPTPVGARQTDPGYAVSAFAADSWRVDVVGATQGEDIEDAGLVSNGESEWLVIVADVTNLTEDDADFAVTDFGVQVDGDVSASGGDAAGTATVVTDLNLRAAPSLDGEILTVMPMGATVTITGAEENGFLPVVFGEIEGWGAVEGFILDGEAPVSSGSTGAIAADATLMAASELGTEPTNLDAAISVAAGESERFTLVFPVPADAEPALALSGESLPLNSTLDADVDLGALPTVAGAPELVEANVVDIVDGATLIVNLDGEELTVSLIGVDSPVKRECFAGDSADELDDLVGNSVLLEFGDADGNEIAAYVWVEQGSSLQLVNHALIANGYAAAKFDRPFRNEPFRAWLEASGDIAEQNEIGLWAECTGPHGKTKPAPTRTPVPPTPTPTLEEIRAEYTPLADVRELAIRPGGMIGDEISFSGTIFTIAVAGPGMAMFLGDNETFVTEAAMQIWVTAPDGTQEAVFVGYDGDTTGMFEGTWVTVYGTVVGTQSGTNAFGGSITQPLVIADMVEIG